MPRHPITQPLPQDLRNQSFRGMNCERWDFSGRDIRGCNFRNTKLNGANFSKAIAGRSKKQITNDVVLIIAGVFAVAVAVALAVAGMGVGVGAGAVAGIFAGAGAGAGAGALAVAVAGALAGVGLLAGTGAGLRAIEAFAKGQTLEGVSWSVTAIVSFMFAIYSARKAMKEFKNEVGTNFQGADLKQVNFSHATLNNCKFDNADTSHIDWSHVTGTRSTIDFTHSRMQLLISRDGKNGKYLEMDLSDQHLVEVELNHANLNGADLTRSNLQDARLDYANLSNVKAGGTDLRRATLTGACIQNWTVNNDTQFDNLICDYIYLTPDQNKQNRRPLSGSFEPGDFEKLVDKFADTLDFILRRGTDPIAFSQSLNQFKHDNPEARIKAILDLDADRVLVQAAVPEGSDKVRIYEEFNFKLQLQEQKITYLEGKVEDKDKTISMMERLWQRPQPTINFLNTNNPTGTLMPSNYVQAGGDAIVAGDNTQGVVGKDMTGVAGRDISGTLNLNLNALRETEDPKAKELVALIEQLRKAIESPDCDLDDRFKKRSIEYLNTLTELAKDKPEGFLKSAKENLDDLTDIADKGSKLVTFAEKHLPTFMMAIGALRLWFGI